MKYINILYTGYRINNSSSPPLPHPYPAPPKSTYQAVIVIYCTRACFHIFHGIFDDSIVCNSCTHISCGVDIILPNLHFCTVKI